MSLLWCSRVSNCEDRISVVAVNGGLIVIRALDAQTCEIISELRATDKDNAYSVAPVQRENGNAWLLRRI
jgi:hypothetical protein